jgi:hypothetical protein
MAIDVAATIRSKIGAGLLPLPPQAPGKVWVGPGSGKVCDACDVPIMAADREYEIDLPDRTIRFHTECLTAWHEQGIGLDRF